MATLFPKVEKRRFVRYLIKERVFAALGENFSRVGKVKDISLGGLCFEFVSDQNNTNSLTKIDIFVVSNGLHLVRIPCRKIYEISSRNTIQDGSANGLTITRCGIEFRHLSEHQINLLKSLIDIYGIRVSQLF